MCSGFPRSWPQFTQTVAMAMVLFLAVSRCYNLKPSYSDKQRLTTTWTIKATALTRPWQNNCHFYSAFLGQICAIFHAKSSINHLLALGIFKDHFRMSWWFCHFLLCLTPAISKSSWTYSIMKVYKNIIINIKYRPIIVQIALLNKSGDF